MPDSIIRLPSLLLLLSSFICKKISPLQSPKWLLLAIIVMNLIFWVGYKNNSCIRETPENSIEFLVQSSLPYILLLMVYAHYCVPYPNDHVYDMRPTCVVHVVWCHFILEPSTPFPYVPLSVLWLCHQVVTDVTAWPINPSPSCSKNRK